MSEVQVYFYVQDDFRKEIENEQWGPYLPYAYGNHWAWVQYDLNGDPEYHPVDSPMIVFYPGEIFILTEQAVEFNDEPDS